LISERIRLKRFSSKELILIGAEGFANSTPLLGIVDAHLKSEALFNS
jgi:hypothetical protein